MTPALMIATAGGIVMAGQISNGQPPAPRQFIGIAVAGAALLLIAQSSPDLAGKFAAVVLTTSLLTSGYDVAKGVSSALGR